MKTFRNRDGSGETAYRHIHEDVDRHGNVRIYFWRGAGHRKIRIRALPGTPEFRAAYDEAAAADTRNDAPGAEAPRQSPKRAATGTWRWLCQRYFASADFQRLGASTRTARRGILEKTWTEPTAPGAATLFGDVRLEHMTARAVRVLRDRKAALPEAANGRVKAARRVFAWALENEPDHVSANPARDVPYLAGSPEGFHTWTVEEVRQYEKRHPIGTRARLALDLLLYTGTRRSDAVRLGRQMERPSGGIAWLHFTEAKGAARRPKRRELPILPVLRASIDACPSGHMTWLVTEFGRPFTPAGFGNRFRKWCDEAGLPHCSAHGLRKAGATIAADNGATAHQLMAIYGWDTLKEADRYTRRANRRRLAGEAMHLLVPADEHESATDFPTFAAAARPVGKNKRKAQ